MPTSEPDAQIDLRAAAESGLMALTGHAGGPPLHPPGLAHGLARLAARVAHWSAECGAPVDVDWADLVTIRAGLLGLRRGGRISANGTCRLVSGPGGWMALSLPRASDLAAVDAIVAGALEGAVEGAGDTDPWGAVERALAASSVTDVVASARLLSVPAAPLGSPDGAAAPWSASRRWGRAGRRAIDGLSIVDLSSMWAGPLAAMLLSRAGGRVVKVESTSRPDGARAVPSFYAALHAPDQQVVALDFGTAEGRRALRALVDRADVVIESSRPRALAQLGAGPDDVAARDGRVWLSITGYGRGAPGRDWVAFGDDAAVAGGLVAWDDENRPVFCGDALADPVTGMVAAAAAFEAIASGGGVLLDVSMQGCAAAVAPRAMVPSIAAEAGDDGWRVAVDGVRVPVRDRADAFQPVSASVP